MADKKISELTAKTTLVAADLLVIVDTEAAPDETKQITAANLATYLASIGSYATLAGVQELDNKTLDSSVLKGTFTASGTVTMPALTLAGAISGGGQNMSNMGDIAVATGKYVGYDATSKITFAANSVAIVVGSGALSITTTEDYNTIMGLRVISTDAGVYGAGIAMYHNSASPAVNDVIGNFNFKGNNSAAEETGYGSLAMKVTNVTDSTESAELDVWLVNGGAGHIALYLTSAGTLWVDENITLDTGQYVGLDSTSNITFVANAVTANCGNAGMTVATTGELKGLDISCTSAGNGGQMRFLSYSASPADNDILARVTGYGKNDAAESIPYGYMDIIATDVSDAAETGKFSLNLYNAGSDNNALYVLGTGALYLDATGDGSATVTLFDKYDDALVLKETIQQQNLEKLVEIGIAERKNTGSGYMINTQSMMRLLAGGIYQSREMIDQIFEELKETKDRLMIAEKKLALLTA